MILNNVTIISRIDFNNITGLKEITQIVATPLPSGGFLLTWSMFSPETMYDVYAQIFNSQGNPLGKHFRVNDYTKDDQRRSVVKTIGNSVVISWQSYLQDGSGWGIFSNVYTLNVSKLFVVDDIKSVIVNQDQEKTQPIRKYFGDYNVDLSLSFYPTLVDGLDLPGWINYNGSDLIFDGYYATNAKLNIIASNSISNTSTTVTIIVNPKPLIIGGINWKWVFADQEKEYHLSNIFSDDEHNLTYEITCEYSSPRCEKMFDIKGNLLYAKFNGIGKLKVFIIAKDKFKAFNTYSFQVTVFPNQFIMIFLLILLLWSFLE